jgi:hypothetical protein
MPPEERAAFLLSRFGKFDGPIHSEYAQRQMVAMGSAAVPALLRWLSDPELGAARRTRPFLPTSISSPPRRPRSTPSSAQGPRAPWGARASASAIGGAPSRSSCGCSRISPRRCTGSRSSRSVGAVVTPTARCRSLARRWTTRIRRSRARRAAKSRTSPPASSSPLKNSRRPTCPHRAGRRCSSVTGKSPLPPRALAATMRPASGSVRFSTGC